MIRRGFTLIEVLLALALMMMLLSAFFIFLRGSGTNQQVARSAANRQLNARALCDLLERDLMCCIAGDAANGAGVNGGATQLSILTRAVNSSLAIGGYEDRSALADLESATFTLNEDSKEITIQREVKRTVALPKASRESEEQPTVSTETVRSIHRLRFRYFDGSSWRESFDSLAENRLPSAVEIALWLHPLEPVSDEDAALADETADAVTEEVGRDGDARLLADESELVPDEEAWRTDEEEEQPPPDVVRIVIIPDSAPGEAATANESEEAVEEEPAGAEVDA